MTCRARFTLSAGLWLVPIHLLGQKPKVQVVFRFQEVTYQQGIDQVRDRPRLEDSVAATLTTLFTDHLRFLSFVGRESPQPPFRLIVALDRRDRGSRAAVVDVGFHVALLGNDSLDTYWVDFRSAQFSLLGLGTIDDILAEIRTDLARLTEADWVRLVADVLSTIPIADSGRVWRQPLRWIVPYRRKDLCLDRKSLLKIQNLVVLPIGTEEDSVLVDANGDFDPQMPVSIPFEQMRGSILGEPRAPVSFSPDSAKVEAVYVIDYRLSRTDCPVLEDPLSH